MTGPILIFGAGGQVGQELMTRARARGRTTVGLTRADVDICDHAAVDAAITRTTPRLIVNAAAYTAVDRAESEPERAAAVNRDAAGYLAVAAAKARTAILHISTDYVFDGTKLGAYVEDDRIAPLGAYGRTKAEGEALVRATNPNSVILRTAWIYGAHGTNFLKTVIRLSGERDRLKVVADQHGCPTASTDLAEAILAVDEKCDPSKAGTYHFAGPNVTTWYAFAEAIVAAQAAFTGRRPAVDPIATADHPTPARRPANSELDSSRFAAVFGYRASDWRVRAKQTVAALLEPRDQAR